MLRIGDSTTGMDIYLPFTAYVVELKFKCYGFRYILVL